MRPNSPYLDSLGKRVLDLAVVTVVAAPAVLLLALVVVAVRVVDGKPVLLRQKRVGRQGREFGMLKIRTMVSKGRHATPRPTALGRLLRRHRLDELPQLLHVLLGQMSMVGPRPELPAIAAGHSRLQRRRLEASPGLTGLWQVKGDHRLRIHDQIGYDLYYVRKATWKLDLAIILRTLLFMTRPGAKGREASLHSERVPEAERDLHAAGSRVPDRAGLDGVDPDRATCRP